MLSVRAFTLAGMVGAALTYVICATAVALAPAATSTLAGAVIHADLSSITREMTWGIFFGGLVFWVALAAGFFAVVGSAYNVFHRGALPAGSRQPKSRVA